MTGGRYHFVTSLRTAWSWAGNMAMDPMGGPGLVGPLGWQLSSLWRPLERRRSPACAFQGTLLGWTPGCS